jgi:N-acetylglucosaminyl-diphospho-decaprenol L-rhamnosyltransferase
VSTGQLPAVHLGSSPLVSISVVSHGQGVLVAELLGDLARAGCDVSTEILLTLNLPEDESFLGPASDLPLRLIRNAEPKGFGANHNAAFRQARGRYFLVLNPDIRLQSLQLASMLDTLGRKDAAVCAPAVYSPDGSPEDNVRFFPTFGRLVRKAIRGRREADYTWNDQPLEVDWAAGMFMLFRHESFAAVNGFDERYFMYYEDADICGRLRLAGWSVWLDPGVAVVHAARRQSHRSFRYLRWHAMSMIRFLLTTGRRCA